MIRNVPQIITAVRATIDTIPDISEKQMKDQFEKLILQPCNSIQPGSVGMSTLVLVIDALDECENEEDVKCILNLMSRVQAVKAIHLRIFVTSRPELPIRLGFKRMLEDIHQDIVLHEIVKDTINHDISAFLSDELANIRDENSLGTSWPENKAVQELVLMASPLFIFAATICRFLGDPNWDPQEQLDILLKYSTRSQASKLDQTYLPVLDRLLIGCDDADTATLLEEFRTVVGSIVILEEPLAANSLANLLNLSCRKVNRRLDALRSVLDIPPNLDQPIHLLHLSFRDFLLDPKKQGKYKFWVDEAQAHNYLARQCLQLLGRPGVLKRNLCELDSPGTLRSEIDRNKIQLCLPAEAQYACRYWVHHLVCSKSNELWDHAYTLFKSKFLYWLEAMSLIERVLDGLMMIDLLRNNVSVSFPAITAITV